MTVYLIIWQFLEFHYCQNMKKIGIHYAISQYFIYTKLTYGYSRIGRVGIGGVLYFIKGLVNLWLYICHFSIQQLVQGEERYWP